MTTIADAPTAETAALLETWTRGWAASRGKPGPVPDGDGWRVEVGLPQQIRRHVFPRISDTLRERAETIHEPWVYLKACITADAMRALLPPRWTVQAPSFFMTFDAPLPRPARLPDGYALSIDDDPESTARSARIARVHAPDGMLAADGHMVIVDRSAIFDRIGTDAAHRRLGLGRAVMSALHADAAERGVTHGLLAATLDGHALYTTFGWRVQSPYASAVILGDPVDR